MRVPINVCLFIAVALFTAQAQARTASEVFEQVSPSVVVVYGYGTKGKKQSQGSGVVLPGGEVATNCHVLKGTSDYSVNYRDKTYPAKIRHSDWDRDVCSLTVPGLNAVPAILGSTRNLKVGQQVYVISAPRGLELTLSEGIVSSLRELDSGRYIQTTAPISPGSSGGGLFDDEGRLVGLPTFYLAEGQQLNFAVPVEWVMALPGRHAKQALTEQSELKWLNQAIALRQKEDWPALLGHAQRWTIAQPRSSAAWNHLGFAYGETGQAAKKIEAYQQALRIKPDIFAWFSLGIAYKEAGQHAKAIEAFQQALRIDPENAGLWHYLGIAYGETGQAAKKIEAYQQALHLKPDAGTWVILGHAYEETGQTAKAIDAYQQALRLNPEYADAWFNLGNVHYDSGQTAKAVEAFQQALRIDPEHANAWAYLGIAYGETGQHTKAIDAFRQALRIDPEYAGAWINLGIAYKNDGQQSRVMEIYHRLKELSPKDADEFFSKVVLP